MSQKITSPQELAMLRDQTRSSLDVRSGPKDIRITVHMGTCGIAAGARDVMAELVSLVDAKSITNVTLRQSGCIGLCDKEPMLTLTDAAGRDYLYVELNKAKVREIVAGHLSGGKPVEKYIMENGGVK
jgi:NADP-reducing hydrogenase subunit HndB